MEESTTVLGRFIRRFANKTCSSFDTKELPSETSARGRQKVASERKKAEARGEAPAANVSSRQFKATTRTFNMETYKLHALGDYVKTIRRFGTTDSYSTQMVSIFSFFYFMQSHYWYIQGELEHRRVKRYFARTNKNNWCRQLTQRERRERLLNHIKKNNDAVKSAAMTPTTAKGPKPQDNGDEPLPFTSPKDHYHMSESRADHIDIPTWLASKQGIPAYDVSTYSILLFASN